MNKTWAAILCTTKLEQNETKGEIAKPPLLPNEAERNDWAPAFPHWIELEEGMEGKGEYRNHLGNTKRLLALLSLYP